MKLYRKEGTVAERPHLNLPKGTFEEEIGLEGFFGPVSHLYAKQPPTSWSSIKRSGFQWPVKDETKEDFLKPQCYRKAEGKVSGDFFESCRALFWNADIAVHLHLVTQSNSVFFRNADASDLLFCHDGSFELESPFGVLKAKKGDYVMVPKGVTWRLHTKAAYLLRLENFASTYKKPETGILGQQALFHEEGLQTPAFSASRKSSSSSTVRVQKDGVLTEIEYPHDICDLAGWCGTLYPFVLPISQIAPVLSSIAHLPPSINATFVTNQFIVCTFLPRPLEEPEGALKVPFYHSNIDYDEVIFYHEGDFFSRDNMGAGFMTLHPRGINHGPHPKALANQGSKKRTDEVAVMVDTVKPLKVTSFARGLELGDYWKSWITAGK
jgi:homogentisate 1,2-dioxygenase